MLMIRDVIADCPPLLPLDFEQPVLTRYPLQADGSPISERELPGALGKFLQQRRYQDLAALRLAGDARRQVHVLPEEVIAFFDRLARVQADTHADGVRAGGRKAGPPRPPPAPEPPAPPPAPRRNGGGTLDVAEHDRNGAVGRGVRPQVRLIDVHRRGYGVDGGPGR